MAAQMVPSSARLRAPHHTPAPQGRAFAYERFKSVQRLHFSERTHHLTSRELAHAVQGLWFPSLLSKVSRWTAPGW